MQRDNNRTYIYMSAACWQDREGEPLTMSDQTAICREFMRNHPELKKVKTFHDRAVGENCINCLKNWNLEKQIVLLLHPFVISSVIATRQDII